MYDVGTSSYIHVDDLCEHEESTVTWHYTTILRHTPACGVDACHWLTEKESEGVHKLMSTLDAPQSTISQLKHATRLEIQRSID